MTALRWRVVLVALSFLAIFAFVGYALAQMSPGMMGGQRGQGQQQSPPMGPGMMGPGGMMGGMAQMMGQGRQ